MQITFLLPQLCIITDTELKERSHSSRAASNRQRSIYFLESVESGKYQDDIKKVSVYPELLQQAEAATFTVKAKF